MVELQMGAIEADAFVNLKGQLAGGRQNEHPNGALPWVRRNRHELLEDGQGECGGFAGACLGRSQNVTPFERGRNSLSLDRSGALIALFGQRVQQWSRQA